MKRPFSTTRWPVTARYLVAASRLPVTCYRSASRHRKPETGFSLVEIMLAVAIFGVLGFVVLSAMIYGRESTTGAVDRNRAAQLANEGLEATRNIARAAYSNLNSYSNGTTYYLGVTANQWNLGTTPSLIDNIFSRTITFAAGPSGSRKVTVAVSWPQTASRTGNLSAATYLADWQATTVPPEKPGLLVYADGSTGNDKISYRVLQTDGSWTSASILDVDTGHNNRAPRVLDIYPAQAGAAKMLLSRHYNGTSQFLYATYWNGTSFLTPQLLATINNTNRVDASNFSGSFLTNGTFLTVYSDNTSTPKYRIFDGSNWGAQASLPALSAFPWTVVVKARPSTNEAMVAFLDNNDDTNTSYYNGSWSAYTSHANNAPSNSRKLVDFDWSPVDKAVGILLYTNTSSDKSIRGRTFTADGAGSGSWNPVINASQGTSTDTPIGSLAIAARPAGATEFIACEKDTDTASPHIECYEITPGGSGFITPAQNSISTSTDPGSQISFGIGYEIASGATGLIAYSNNNNEAKLETYDTSSNSWSNISIRATAAGANIKRAELAGRPYTDDAMVIVSDGNRELYSVMYNGTSNALYSSPAGKAWTIHNANGPDNDADWFGFAWDN